MSLSDVLKIFLENKGKVNYDQQEAIEWSNLLSLEQLLPV